MNLFGGSSIAFLVKDPMIMLSISFCDADPCTFARCSGLIRETSRLFIVISFASHLLFDGVARPCIYFATLVWSRWSGELQMGAFKWWPIPYQGIRWISWWSAINIPNFCSHIVPKVIHPTPKASVPFSRENPWAEARTRIWLGCPPIV